VLRDLFSIHLGPSLGEHAEPLDRRFRLCRSLLARIQIVGGLLAVEFCVALRVSEVVQQLLGGGVRTGLEIGLEASEKICAAGGTSFSNRQREAEKSGSVKSTAKTSATNSSSTTPISTKALIITTSEFALTGVSQA
jgi:hypothetical protein